MVTLDNGSFTLGRSAGIYVVLEGEGTIVGDGYKKEIKRGDYFLLPENAKDKFSIGGNIKFAECFA
jgi:mannose-6-phosphate isomerase-like protein (cupin superfamily)